MNKNFWINIVKQHKDYLKRNKEVVEKNRLHLKLMIKLCSKVSLM